MTRSRRPSGARLTRSDTTNATSEERQGKAERERPVAEARDRDALDAARDAPDVEHGEPEDLGGPQGHERPVVLGEPPRREDHEQPDERRDQRADDQPQPGPTPGSRDGRGVGADRERQDLAEVDEPGQCRTGGSGDRASTAQMAIMVSE